MYHGVFDGSWLLLWESSAFVTVDFKDILHYVIN